MIMREIDKGNRLWKKAKCHIGSMGVSLEKQRFFDELDGIDDIETLKAIEETFMDKNIMPFFWEQYRLALYGETEVIKKRARIKCRYICMEYSAGIPFSKNIQKFRTPHGLRGILLSQYAKIGEGCTLFQHVTIGSNTLPDSKGGGFPTIGKNVYIGAGASVIGNVTVGDNVRIGANCIVTKDVPENSIIVLDKPVVFKKGDEPLNNRFLPAKKYRDEYLNKKSQ